MCKSDLKEVLCPETTVPDVEIRPLLLVSDGGAATETLLLQELQQRVVFVNIILDNIDRYLMCLLIVLALIEISERGKKNRDLMSKVSGLPDICIHNNMSSSCGRWVS
jgi:hypothetical protein